TRIKICGVTALDNALACAEAGADLLGFNFYARSPRCVTLEAARAMAEGAGSAEGREGAQAGDGEEDPLGRPRRSRSLDGARVGIPETIDVERARRILDDIRRRLGDPTRPSEERDYLDRLLEID
ncbi:MAG: DUF4175 family protein, partial [Phyllobacteriaceae bacterium]|nr:DUF4175 family protein [Phyllobacteriaceae bacterium]